MTEKLKICIEDSEQICSAAYIPWDALRKKTILITGATGLIGSNIVSALLYANKKKKLNLKILALVREINKGKEFLSKQLIQNHALSIVVGTMENLPVMKEQIDYIIHMANPTESSYFVSNPVETIQMAVMGTEKVLKLAKEKQVKGFVYTSSMEVYGHPVKGNKVTEENVAGFDPAIVRNSYPISKQMCEALCCAYAEEYMVPAKIVRLTQTIGPGVKYSDNRVFAEFMRCVVEKKNIVLKTKGETERCYLYTGDAVLAILTVLLKGNSGQGYTAANPETYCSVKHMAELVANQVAKGAIHVEINETYDNSKLGYADTLYMDLDISKLEKLGWYPTKALSVMYLRMIEAIER